MIIKEIEVKNRVGLHARPVSIIAAEASKFQSDIQIRHRNVTVNAKSTIKLLALGINSGECIELCISGQDENKAFERLNSIFDSINYD